MEHEHSLRVDRARFAVEDLQPVDFDRVIGNRASNSIASLAQVAELSCRGLDLRLHQGARHRGEAPVKGTPPTVGCDSVHREPPVAWSVSSIGPSR